MKKNLFLTEKKMGILFAALLLLCAAACRKEPGVIPSTETEIPPPAPSDTTPKRPLSFYLLNEGNMGMNKASLDRFNTETSKYQRNIYSEANPEVPKELGDVGNDIGIYGNKVFAVINMSDKVEVMNVSTGKRIGKIDIVNCRYVTFANGKAYVSSYDTFGDTEAKGFIVEIDTTTLQIVRKVLVGRQPEEMAIVGSKLYIANSGGYNSEDYERTVSVVDLNSFTETKRIDVAINLHRLKADQYGDLYVTSRGDYLTIPSRLFVIDTKTDAIKKTFELGASNLSVLNDYAYVYSAEWNHTDGGYTITYAKIDVKEETIINKAFITDGTDKGIKMPYGIAIDPVTEDFYVTDAKDYVTPGELYCFGKDGKMKWKVETGDIPAHMAFIKK